MALSEASVDTIKGAVNCGYAKIGGVVSLDLSVVKEISHSLVHWKLFELFGGDGVKVLLFEHTLE